MRCVICSRESGANNYCPFHSKAHENLVAKYEQWKEATRISWKEYLSEIVKNSLTGEWAREVAEYLIESGEQTDVKECQEKRF